MKKYIGSLFFAAAAIYLAVAGELAPMTVLVVALCSLCAYLSINSPLWAVLGGAALISGSLLLQALYNQKCTACLRADVLVLCGVVFLTVIFDGKLTVFVRGVAGVMAVAIIAFFMTAGPGGGRSDFPSLSNGQPFGRNITVSDGREEINLDTEEKSVLLFSPKCGACHDAIERLAKADPRGERWVAVQTGGDLTEGKEYLNSNGYQGNTYVISYSGAVPAFVSTKSGKTTVTNNVEEMLNTVTLR